MIDITDIKDAILNACRENGLNVIETEKVFEIVQRELQKQFYEAKLQET